MMVCRSCHCFSAYSASEVVFSFALTLSEDQKFRRSLPNFLLPLKSLLTTVINSHQLCRSAGILQARNEKRHPETVIFNAVCI